MNTRLSEVVRTCKHAHGFRLGFALGVFAPGANFNQVLAFHACQRRKWACEAWIGLSSSFSVLAKGENELACLPKAKRSLRNLNWPCLCLPQAQMSLRGLNLPFVCLPKAKMSLRSLNLPFLCLPQAKMSLRTLNLPKAKMNPPKKFSRFASGPRPRCKFQPGLGFWRCHNIKVILRGCADPLRKQFAQRAAKPCLGFALGVFAPGANFNRVLAIEGVAT